MHNKDKDFHLIYKNDVSFSVWVKLLIILIVIVRKNSCETYCLKLAARRGLGSSTSFLERKKWILLTSFSLGVCWSETTLIKEKRRVGAVFVSKVSLQYSSRYLKNPRTCLSKSLLNHQLIKDNIIFFFEKLRHIWKCCLLEEPIMHEGYHRWCLRT
jgi:hypothetical protein